jgi:tRNA-specific 2-thiouridylase
VDDARDVADRLGIPFYVLNCEDEFKEKVIDPFVSSYMAGQTPLPCVNCNTYLKFDHLVKKMRELSCDYLATGHYATLQQDEQGRWGILTSADDWKDQTYFLFTMESELIPKLIFPIGEMKKAEVRRYAEQKNLIVANKKDSVGICFIDKSGYGEFIDSYNSSPNRKTGTMRRYPSGKVLRRHNGIHHFTYGQRKGLGISAECPLYVLKVDPDTHEVWVGEEQYLFSQEMTIADCHWLAPLEDKDYTIKIRYSHRGAPARVEKMSDGQIRVVFHEKQRAITPGQAAVFYDGQRLVGGGWIR